MTQEALKLAIQLRDTASGYWTENEIPIIEKLIRDLAQTQEPVAWTCLIDSADFSKNTITLVMQCDDYKVSAGTHWLSTAPPQRTWVGLTDKEITALFGLFPKYPSEWDAPDFYRLTQAIEAKLKEKNNGV